MLSLLVVDDDATLRQMVAQVFAEEGYTVREAVDGVDALAQLATDRPDAMLIDMRMPLMDGPVLASRCHELQGCADLPVILMTGMEPPHLMPGISGYLRKPFDLDDLLSAVETAAQPAAR